MIDLNCDMGEGIGNDEAIMPFIDSANIACGFHAGDETTIRNCVRLAIHHNVHVGAHPSFSDREHFGRKEFELSDEQITSLITEQLLIISRIVEEEGGKLHHVKAHGALYNMAARDQQLAKNIAMAIIGFNDKLILYGLSGSHLITEAKKMGLSTLSEVFADRAYNDDGSLVARSLPGALIESEEQAIRQVRDMITKNSVTTITGKSIPITAETICVHGDGNHAVEFAEVLRHTLDQS